MKTLMISLLLVAPNVVQGMPYLLDYVPSYRWYHGCSPTASTNIIGYWDLHGYDDLFYASGWDEVRKTSNVKDEISSPNHNAKYDSNPDNSNLPEPSDTSIADFMGTSQGNLGFGGTWISKIDNGIEDYTAYKGYSFDTGYILNSWEEYINEIDLGNPVLLNVDSSGNGRVDHSITGIGYEDRGAAGLWYASYNTWHESERTDWYEFRPTSNEYIFGLSSLVYVHPPSTAPVPEPSTIVLFGVGLVGLLISKFRLHS